MSICVIDGCDKPMLARGWCATHYKRWSRHGDPNRGFPQIVDRLPELIEVTPFGCWSWAGFKDRKGYGQVGYRGYRTARAHRIIYMELVGPIPDELHLDHLCRNHACVNPDHLEPVTCRENILRGRSSSAVNAMKKRCVNGHEFTPENTYVRKNGARTCRKCHAANSARYYSKKRAS